MDHDLTAQPGAGPDAASWSAALAAVLSDPAKVQPSLQPIIDLKRGVVAGYELLARFDHPNGESPAAWFATACALGCVDQLDAVILKAARRFLPKLPANTFLAVNVTSQGAVSPAVLDAVRVGERLDAMVIELTEQSDVEDIERLADASHKMRARGAMIAIDDAGAGFAGLQRILSVRPEFIKVDRSLVARVDGDPARAATIEMLGALANRIDAWLVAEGVERKAELDRLMQMNVPLAQGYLFARPTPSFEQPDTAWIRKLASPAKHDPPDCIAPLLETPQPAQEEAGADDLDWRFGDDEGLEFLPIIDERERPVGLVERGATSPIAIIKVLPSTLTAEALGRAMTRPREIRLAPLVCCDEVGRYLGLIRVERLIEHLIASKR